MNTNLQVIKIGGNIINDPPALHRLLDTFAALPAPKILVHGGGKRATELSKRLGITPKLIDGRRITKTADLEIVTMVYAGLLNKNIVAQLQARDCRAIGLSGADGDCIRAVRRAPQPIDFGWVGDVSTINTNAVTGLLEQGMTPVFCALTHDGAGNLLNTNADTIATELAIGMTSAFEVQLLYCFEKRGVLAESEDDNSRIPQLDHAAYQKLRAEGVIHSGMLPKLDNAFRALRAGVGRVVIGEQEILRDRTAGTQVVLSTG